MMNIEREKVHFELSTYFHVGLKKKKKKLLDLRTSRLIWANKTPEITFSPKKDAACNLSSSNSKGIETITLLFYQAISSHHEPAWPRFYFLNTLRLSPGCAFFPTGLLVLHPAGRPRQCITTHADKHLAERRQTRTQVLLLHIWDLWRPSHSGCHQSEQIRAGHFSPSANQRASLLFTPK